MSDNKTLVQTLYAAFGAGDLATIISHLDPDIQWQSNCNATTIPWGGTHLGHAGATRFFEALGTHLDFSLFEPRRYIAEGHAVCVSGRTVATIKATGRRFDSEWVHLFTFAGNKVQSFQEFYDTAAIVDALALAN